MDGQSIGVRKLVLVRATLLVAGHPVDAHHFAVIAPNPLLSLGNEIPLVHGFFYRQAGVRWRGDAICCLYRGRVPFGLRPLWRFLPVRVLSW